MRVWITLAVVAAGLVIYGLANSDPKFDAAFRVIFPLGFLVVWMAARIEERLSRLEKRLDRPE